jgi:hypothetical protein
MHAQASQEESDRKESAANPDDTKGPGHTEDCDGPDEPENRKVAVEYRQNPGKVLCKMSNSMGHELQCAMLPGLWR